MDDTAYYEADSEAEDAAAVGPRPPTARSMSKRPPSALRTVEVRSISFVEYFLSFWPKTFQ